MKLHATDLTRIMDNASVSLRSTPMEGMACTYAEIKEGTDLAPALRGLPDDACPVPHWGYLLKGTIRIRYADGREETLRPGELFYLPPGHLPVFEEDCAFVEFSPQREYDKLLAHFGRQAQA
jgi:glyoxylate utilization-related uncharacterized protein